MLSMQILLTREPGPKWIDLLLQLLWNLSACTSCSRVQPLCTTWVRLCRPHEDMRALLHTWCLPAH